MANPPVMFLRPQGAFVLKQSVDVWEGVFQLRDPVPTGVEELLDVFVQ